MNIFQAAEYCYKYPYKQVEINKERIHYDPERGGFVYQENGCTDYNFNLNEFDLNDDRWHIAIEKHAFKDLFSDWCDGRTIACEMDGEEWVMAKDSTDLCNPKTVKRKSLYITIQPDIANQQIFYIKE